MTDWESSFNFWAAEPSNTEKTKIENAERAVRDALAKSNSLSNRDCSVFTQGSYRNRVNVRQDSDVDVGIVCKDTFFHDGASDLLLKSFKPATYEYSDYRKAVQNAITNHFGYEAVTLGNKALDIKANTYRVEADLAYFFEYRWYYTNGRYEEGVVMFDTHRRKIINWPEQHYNNAVSKNTQTDRRFKKCVRILKKLKLKMAEDGNQSCNQVPGFLIECLVYNVENVHFQNNTLTNDIRTCLSAIYAATTSDIECQDWTEVSGLKCLFGGHQKWTRQQANQFAYDARNYLGFGQ